MDWKKSLAAEDDFDCANPHACLPPTWASYRQAKKAQAEKAQAEALPARPAVGKATSEAGAPPENPPENPPDNPPGYPAPAPEIFDPLVSMVTGAFGKKTVDFSASSIIQEIASGEWEKEVEAIRQIYDATLIKTGSVKEAKVAVRAEKEKLMAVLWAGTFRGRGDANCKAYSGLLCADLDDLFDKLGEAGMNALRGRLEADSHVCAIFISPSGGGLKAVFRVPLATDAREHHQNFLAVQKRVKDRYGLDVDKSCKNPERLCFISYDPKAAWNGDAVPLPQFIEDAAMPARAGGKKEPERGSGLDRYRPKTKPVSAEKLRELLMGDGGKYRGIPADDRENWLKVLGAIKLWGQEAGEEDLAYELADAWARTSKKHRVEEQIKLWNSLNREEGDNVAAIGTIFYLARQHGWKSSAGGLDPKDFIGTAQRRGELFGVRRQHFSAPEHRLVPIGGARFAS